MRGIKSISLIFSGLTALTACGSKRDTPAAAVAPATPATPAAPRFLYVASGSCYGGDATAGALSTGSNTVVRYNIDTGAFDSLIADYNKAGFGDSPAGIIDNDASSSLVLIENTGGRRVDYLQKASGIYSTYLANSNLATQARQMIKLADGGLLISKTTAIEKFTVNKVRLTNGVNPFINAPTGTGNICATSTTLMVGAAELSSGKLVFIHSGATPNNKFGVTLSTGFNAATDCVSAQTAPSTTALPTAVLREAVSGHVLVAYGSSTTASNYIYSYVVDPNSGAISSPVAAFTDVSYVSAPSAMVQDPVTHVIYIANGRASFNSIEKFTYNPTTQTLTRVTPTYITSSI